MPEPEFVMIKDACAILGVSRTKLWRLIKDGRLKSYKDPRDERATLVRKDDLQQFMKVQEVEK